MGWIQSILGRRSGAASFSLPILPAVVVGGILTAITYSLIEAGPLDSPSVRRYLCSHPVAYATVGFFFVAVVALAFKAFLVLHQRHLFAQADGSLAEISRQGDAIEPEHRSQWIIDSWQKLSQSISQSWLGQRVIAVAQRQTKRLGGGNLDSDMEQVATLDADRQHESYGLVRIVSWAMPMLGFLGTVLGISATLGQLDTQLLATQQQAAMDQLTAGLYVAFDTTALALSLTVVVMFIQFGINRIEQDLLLRIDQSVRNHLTGILLVPEVGMHNSDVEWMRRMTGDLLEANHQLVSQQATLWQATIQDAHSHWVRLTGAAGEQVQDALASAIDQSLEKHAAHWQQIQEQGAEQVDARWQQWQLTLSEQARVMHTQQKELSRQAELLTQLINSVSDISKLEVALDQNLKRLTDVDRFHEAAICMAEAVAVLATQMERSGLLGARQPVRKSTAATHSVTNDSSINRGKAA